MPLNNFRHIPCGEAIPANNPHAISMSLPRIADVIGYEEQDPELLQRLQAGYPRFFMNHMLRMAMNHVRNALDIPSCYEIVPVSSIKAIQKIEQLLGSSFNALEKDGLFFIVIDCDSRHLIPLRKFIQHSGLLPSSRRAEAYLLKHGILTQEFQEPRVESNTAVKLIQSTLADAYGQVDTNDIVLSNSGMTATYAVFSSLQKLQQKRNRTCFVQYGWLYIDTMEIIKKYSNNHYLITNISQTDVLEQWLSVHHTTVAAIFTELPNNPMMQFVDLPKLYRIAKKYQIPLVIDGTLGTPFNLELISYADIAVESLTKFACGSGSLMMGCIVLRQNSIWAKSCKEFLPEYNEPPFVKEIQHLGACMASYQQRASVISENTSNLIPYFVRKKQIKHIFSALSEDTLENFCKVRKSEQAIPGLVSIVFDRPLSHYYDRLMLPKGPSLGNNFTVAMPYFYLAHWDLIKSIKGREKLLQLGVQPDLLRISVGTEPIDELIDVFEKVF
jgi:cystathionine gamma-synthase